MIESVRRLLSINGIIVILCYMGIAIIPTIIGIGPFVSIAKRIDKSL